MAVAILLFIACFSWIWHCTPKDNYERAIKFQSLLSVGDVIPDEYGDVLFVFGSGCNPGCGTEERLKLAVQLYRIKKRKIIFSEGNCYPDEFSGFVYRMMFEFGIKKEDILVDSTGSTTEKNVSNSVLLAQKHGLKSAIVCTSPFHQLRCSILMFRSDFPDYKIAAMPDSLLELDRELVYRNKRWNVVKNEIKKSVYSLFL